MCDRLIHRNPMLACQAVCQRRLVLVVARRAHLLVGREPVRLRLLDCGQAARRRLANPRVVISLRADEGRKKDERREHER